MCQKKKKKIGNCDDAKFVRGLTLNEPSLKTSKKAPLHGNFLHITDFHPDPHYLANSTVKSKCHGGHPKGRKRPRFAGTWGSSVTSCDTPMSLVNATFNWLEKNWNDKLDFIIWTGDNSSDDNIPRTAHEIYELNRMIATKFIETFSTKGIRAKNRPQFIPIVPSIGNHDIHPNNILLPGPNDVLSILHSIWQPFIPGNQRETFLKGGYYYTEVIPKKLMVISLNTIYFYNANTAVNGCKSPEQPGTIEMNWLKEVLRKARKRGLRVYLTGHVAPRKKQYTKSCYRVYQKLSIKYHDLILGHYYGHSNMDHFFFIGAKRSLGKFKRNDSSIANDYYDDDDDYTDDDYTDNYADYIEDYTEEYDSYDKKHFEISINKSPSKINKYLNKLYNHYRSVPPLTEGVGKEYAVVHINPSIIPVFHPALRIFKYNTTEVEHKKKNKRPKSQDPEAPSHKNTFLTPLGYTQYFINLTHSNLFPNQEPEYNIEYTTWDDYDMKDLTVPSWINLARKVTNRKFKNVMWRKIQGNLMVGTKSLVGKQDIENQYIISEEPDDLLEF
ncbi:4055_t:CDS:2 [Cetraspora pellucida]|uniref:4055_t:CDS:1 n=1 Tax=Cetraspora pellucida TaxID=1433469 RepID=A0ACA9KA95_9GLOM|nr:4055_t:CDS:2 [Cetraspora pellucida]